MPIHIDNNIPPLYLNLTSDDYTSEMNTVGSHFSFDLSQSVEISDNVDAWLSVENFKFTNSFYNINRYNNVFYYGLASGGYSQNTVTIPQKNYNISSLVSYLNTNVANGFVFSYDETTLKMTITNSEEFRLFAGANNVLKVLGFSNTLQQSVSNVLTSNNVVNLLGIQMIYILINNLSFNSIGVKNSTRQLKNTLINIPVTAIQGDAQLYSAQNSNRHKLFDKTISLLEIKIVDENGNEIDFNGVSWYLSLQLVFTYIKENKAFKDFDDTAVPKENEGGQRQKK